MMTRDLDLRMLNALAGDLSNQVCDIDSKLFTLCEQPAPSLNLADALKFKRKIIRSKLSDLHSRIRIEKIRLSQKALVDYAVQHCGFTGDSPKASELPSPSASANIEIVEQARAIQYRKLKAGKARQDKVIAQIHEKMQGQLDSDDELLVRYIAFVNKTDRYLEKLFRSVKAKREELIELYQMLPERVSYQMARSHIGALECDRLLARLRYQSTYLRRKKNKAG
jgi:hypothetical protein